VLEAAANEVASKLPLVRSPEAEPATPYLLVAMKGLLAERLSRLAIVRPFCAEFLQETLPNLEE
jgi:hypothetical protein